MLGHSDVAEAALFYATRRASEALTMLNLNPACCRQKLQQKLSLLPLLLLVPQYRIGSMHPSVVPEQFHAERTL